MKDLDISDLADLSREHSIVRDGVERAIESLEEIMRDSAGWRKRNGNTVEHFRLRRDLPYCIHLTELKGTQILVNRNYKPIGSNVATGEGYATYEDYTNSHVKLTSQQISSVAESEKGYFFGEAGSPWTGKKEARAYLERLRKLLKLI